MPAEADLYRVLQVDPSADPDVIVAAYKRLAFKYHPDRNPGDARAEEQMKQINEAFRVLGKPRLRADYDAQTGARLPQLEVIPSDVLLRGFDPNAREIRFSIRLEQKAGPTFDPSIHRIDLALLPPWHRADVHWHWREDRLPAHIDFALAVGDGFLKPGSTLTGDIELIVTAKETA